MPSVGMAIAQPSPSRDTTHCRHRRLNPQDELAYLSRLFAGIAIKTLKRSGRLVQRRSAEVAAVWLPLRFVNWHYYDKNVAKG
jgi:hypothetical protein